MFKNENFSIIFNNIHRHVHTQKINTKTHIKFLNVSHIFELNKKKISQIPSFYTFFLFWRKNS